MKQQASLQFHTNFFKRQKSNRNNSNNNTDTIRQCQSTLAKDPVGENWGNNFRIKRGLISDEFFIKYWSCKLTSQLFSFKAKKQKVSVSCKVSNCHYDDYEYNYIYITEYNWIYIVQLALLLWSTGTCSLPTFKEKFGNYSWNAAMTSVCFRHK